MVNNQKAGQSVVDRVWSFFSSITLAVIIFAIISLTSIVGTIVEQQAEPERNIKLLTKFFGDAAPGVYRVLDALGFTNMFHSWWFMALLFLFAANLIVCSLDRFPKIWKMAKEPVKPLPPDLFASMPVKRETVVKEKPEAAQAKVEGALKKIGFTPAAHQEEGAVQVYAEKGRYSRLGVYVVHLSILIILIGAVVGVLAGFNASLNLLEGTSSAVAYLGSAEMKIPLGFEVRCDDFEVSFYENSDTPKAFRSWLTVVDNGKEILKKQIDVNHPLKYKGITFYQSSYGFSPSRDSLFKFTVTSGGKTEAVGVRFGEPFPLPGTNVTAKVADFSPALGMDQSGKLFTYAEMMNNPAVFMEFYEGGKVKYKQWILKRYPQTWKVPDGVVEFKDLWGAQYTGLQVRKDPGVWIVYLGCLVMGIGLYAAFFMHHARVWVRLREEKGAVRVSLAASTNKNKLAFEQKMDTYLSSLEQ
ncbi:MAG: cytochrome c biogenesis protein ResB [Thermodesulfovibrionales bacterium]